MKKRTTVPEPASDVRGIVTERNNPRTVNLDSKSALEIARTINAEDLTVPRAMEPALPQIARAIDAAAEALAKGGRIIYVGTGTSGRLGALDASECPPTFNADPKMVQFVMAGGEKALARSVEADEDSPDLGRRDMARKKPTSKDCIIGLAASGRTPYTIAAVHYARQKGAKTVALTANPGSPLERTADISIGINVGPEVVAGSTRMKAGTMQKLVLNMITTGAFTRLGYVYGNLMVNVHLKNRKLVERAIGIVQHITRVTRERALQSLKDSGGSVPLALVMLHTGDDLRTAARKLKAAKNNVRTAISTP